MVQISSYFKISYIIYPFIYKIFCFLNLSIFFAHYSLSYFIFSTFFYLAFNNIFYCYFCNSPRYFLSYFCFSYYWTFSRKAFSRFYSFICRSFASFFRCSRFSSLIVSACLTPSFLYYMSYSLNYFTSKDLRAFYPCFLMLFQSFLSYFFKYSNRLFRAVTSCSCRSLTLLYAYNVSIE